METGTNKKLIRSVRIVLASPSDLAKERLLISNMIHRNDHLLKKRYDITLDLRRWEDTTPGSNLSGGQGVIDVDLEIEKSDIFICLFWKQAGSVIEKTGETGTEHELMQAIDSFQKHGKPDIKLLMKKPEGLDKKSPEYRKLEGIKKKAEPYVLYSEFSTAKDLEEIINGILLEIPADYMRRKPAEKLEQSTGQALNEEELINAISSGTSIVLKDRFYDVTSGKSNLNEVLFSEMSIGSELIIRDITQLTLLGNNSKIITASQHAAVLTFENCSDINICNISMGHTPKKGDCTGVVLRFIDCCNIDLTGLNLYGCGTYGLELTNCSEVHISGCHIYDCTKGAILLEGASLHMKNTIISECRNIEGNLLNLKSSYIDMENVLIRDNEIRGAIFSLEESIIFGDAISIINNQYSEIGFDDCLYYLENNHVIGGVYYGGVQSEGKISQKDFEWYCDYISSKGEIRRAEFINGEAAIDFSVKSMQVYEEFEEYFARAKNMVMPVG